MIVLCSRLRRSNIRTEPSAPQETKTSTLAAQKRTSKTSLSWAMSCVLAVRLGMSQIVHVVSMEEVIMRLGETTFQSSDVIGAVCSGDFEFDRRAKGINFLRGISTGFLVIVLPEKFCWSFGKDHNRRWSPDVASRSWVCLFDEGGSHSILVTG
jgi:hypothetical protein